MKIEKGRPGYIRFRKTKYLLWAVIEFAVVIALVVIGIVQSGSRMNLLTVVAVVGCLPAAKMFVEYITMALIRALRRTSAKRLKKKHPF